MLNKITGLVERITFYNSESGFCVIKVKIPLKSELVTVTGNISSIFVGEQLKATGEWFQDKVHGLQFKAQVLSTISPTSVEGIERYLASGIIKGIGKTYARKLMEFFGAKVLEIIEHEPALLNQVPGIGKARANMITQSYETQKSIREIMLFLHSYGISTSRAMRIYKEYSKDAIELIKQNPYRLAKDIKGIGFKTADKIAQSLGILKSAGINHVLESAVGLGSCGMPIVKLIENSQKELEVSKEEITPVLDLAIKQEDIVIEAVESSKQSEIDCAFLKSLVVAERQLAASLLRMTKGRKLVWPQIDPSQAIEQLALENIKLSPSQEKAIRWALHSCFMIITGGPGVGKTTLINSLIKILKSVGIKILLAAPTGRAAKRLSEATAHPAYTIHRLLKRNPEHEFHKNIDLNCQLLIVDEASMLDIPLMHGIVKALPENAALFLVGDTDQLPSIGPGQVLSDIITSKAFTVAALKEVFRQEAQSNIITNAYRVNAGEMPIFKDADGKNFNDFFFIPADSPESAMNEIISLVANRLPQKFGASIINELQVLSPMTKGAAGTINLNTQLQNALIPSNSLANEVSLYGTNFKLNDKVMQIINNYDKDVYNGDIGFICSINKEDQEVMIMFDTTTVAYDFTELDQIVLAYAITIHKSQGSEYPIVIIPLLMQHYPMLQRNLIYTALTRAKKMVIIVGQEAALQMAIAKQSSRHRYTTLKTRIMELSPPLF